jgi:hypothetical protein
MTARSPLAELARCSQRILLHRCLKGCKDDVLRIDIDTKYTSHYNGHVLSSLEGTQHMEKKSETRKGVTAMIQIIEIFEILRSLKWKKRSLLVSPIRRSL